MMMPLAAGVLGTDQTASSNTDAIESTHSIKQCYHSSSSISNRQQNHSSSSVECGYEALPKPALTAAVADVELTALQHRNGRHRHTMQDSNSTTATQHNGVRQRIRSQSPSRTVAVTGLTVSDAAVTSPHSSLLPLHTVHSHFTATGTDNNTTTATATSAMMRCSDSIDVVCNDGSDHVAFKPGDNLRKAVALGIAYSATLGKSQY
jgi:hypothetical protein